MTARPDPSIRRSTDPPGWVIALLVVGVVANAAAFALGVFL